MRRAAAAMALLAGLGLAAVAWAQQPAAETAPPPAAPPASTPAAPPLATDLFETIDRIPVRVRDLYGREEERSIAVTSFRPQGAGPFPVAIVSHGRALQSRRHLQGRQRFETLARWLVQRGYAVFVPTRVGYGDTFGAFDPEFSGSCGNNRFEALAAAGADQILATLEHARGRPFADGSRWIAIGQSVGGVATIAVAARRPPGLVAAVNFAGGAGGDPEGRPANPCGAPNLERLIRQMAGSGGTSTGAPPVPMLWLYWTHDRYWGAELPQRWAEAWRAGGGAAEFHSLPPWPVQGDAVVDGHNGLGADLRTWAPIVDAYLKARLGAAPARAAGQ